MILETQRNSPVMTDGAVFYCTTISYRILDSSRILKISLTPDLVGQQLLNAKLIAHCFDLIAKMVRMEHPGLTLWLTASNRSKTLVFLCQGNLYVNFFQF